MKQKDEKEDGVRITRILCTYERTKKEKKKIPLYLKLALAPFETAAADEVSSPPAPPRPRAHTGEWDERETKMKIIKRYKMKKRPTHPPNPPTRHWGFLLIFVCFCFIFRSRYKAQTTSVHQIQRLQNISEERQERPSVCLPSNSTSTSGEH